MVDRLVPMIFSLHQSPYSIHDDHDRPQTKRSQSPFSTLSPPQKHDSETSHLVVPKKEPKNNDRDQPPNKLQGPLFPPWFPSPSKF